jgi:hypothetical protein
MAILGKIGVTPEMRFPCMDCGEVITGEDVLDDEIVHIVKVNQNDPSRSLWRCECCQLEWEESQME